MFGLVLSEDRMSFRPRRQEIISGLKQLPELIKEVLTQDAKVLNIAQELYKNRSILIMGRGYNFSTCLEGALKIKELTYMHCEGTLSFYINYYYNIYINTLLYDYLLFYIIIFHYIIVGIQSGELKHGPLALVDKTVPIIMIIMRDNVHNKCMNALQQVTAREGRPIIVCEKGDKVSTVVNK